MDLSSRKTIHMGVNFILTPMPVLDHHFSLSLQRFLNEEGISLTRVQHSETELLVFRDRPTPLNIKVGVQGPLGQLLIVSPWPERDVKAFSKEAEAVVRAFEFASATSSKQIISKDATIRDLYETDQEHAFMEIWEGFLGQSPEKLAMLEKRVLGGGLRFVMPPQAEESDPVQVEVKIESFLRDTSKIYIEVQFTWPQPSEPGAKMRPTDLLAEVDAYIQDIAARFSGGHHNG